MASSSKVSIRVEIDTSEWDALYQRLDKTMKMKTSSGIYGVLDTVGKKTETWAKKNAPWQDRTTNARRGLNGGAMKIDKDTAAMFIAHAVSYGIYLELSHQRRFAILEKAIEKFEPEVVRQINNIINKVAEGKAK